MPKSSSRTKRKAKAKSKPEYLYQEYIDQVLTGRILVCKAVRKAVERHVSDLERAKSADFQYCFKPAEANRVIQFFRFLRGEEGQFFNQPIELLPWQQFVVACIYGWRRKTDGLRRFRKAYVQIGKKSGKSTMCSGLQLYGMTEEPGAQVYSIAGKREQAEITFDAATKMVEKSPDLLDIFTLKKAAIESDLDGQQGVYRALASNYNTSDGKNASMLVVDEYHGFSNSKLVNAVESGMIMRLQPLTMIITTAGGNKAGPCYELYGYLKKLLDRIIEDETFFGIIYELDEGDDWRDESKWIKALPSLGVITSLRELQATCKIALELASEEYEFRSKILNQWMDVMKVWIDSDIWKKNRTPFDLELLKGRDCWAAVDLSRTRDLTTCSLCFPIEARFKMLHLCFIPQEALKHKQEQEHVLFRRWVDEGLVITTPGSSIDYDYLVEEVLKAGKLYNVREVAFDPYNAASVDDKLQKEGFLTIGIRQGLAYFSPITKAWEVDVLKARIDDPNPIMQWCLSNAVIKPDTNGNYKPLKSSEGAKIDLVVTSIMAHSRATSPQAEPEPETYGASDFVFPE